MKNLLGVSLGALLVSSGCGSGGQTGDEHAGGVIEELRGNAQRLVAQGPENGAASQDNQDFAWRLFQLESDPAENAVMSPYSISVAAAMLSAGARGQTLEEIREALSFSLAGEDFHAAHNRLLQVLDTRNHEATEERNAQDLRLSNDFWISPDLRPTDEFLNVLSSHYGAPVHLARFATEPEAVREAINQKVADDTNQLIDELLPTDSIRPNTVFVLTNAIYFKARWEFEFPENLTMPAEFLKNDGTSAMVDMMHGEITLRYQVTDDYQAIAMPYFGRELELIAIMPTGATFTDFVAGLSGDGVDQLVEDLEIERIDLRFPKMEIESSLPLKAHLQALGMQAAFTPSADLSGIAPNTMLSDAFHDARMILDEEGTEAAAATAFVGVPTSAPPQPVPLSFNRPFVFLIRDISTNATLFTGQFVTP